MTERPVAVEVVDVSKKFRLFKERNNSLKATIMRGRRVIAEDFWALKDVSFEVYEGETFGLIGENGSGKSTMLKCLTKILRPNEGTVMVNGKVSALLELGAGFHPELTGRENVFLNGAILGLSQKELRRRFDDIVDFAGVGAFIDEPVKNYSSGMYVRLGFSVAINVDPDVLLVDEVLAVGDEGFQRKCNEKFAELRNQGKTIVLVTHGLGVGAEPLPSGGLVQPWPPHAGRPAQGGHRGLHRDGAGGPPGRRAGPHPVGLGRGPDRRGRAVWTRPGGLSTGSTAGTRPASGCITRWSEADRASGVRPVRPHRRRVRGVDPPQP